MNAALDKIYHEKPVRFTDIPFEILRGVYPAKAGLSAARRLRSKALAKERLRKAGLRMTS
jgi:hypothetical protein